MISVGKYQAMLCKLENTDYSNEQLYNLSKMLLRILINKEKANDEIFDLLSSIYQKEGTTHGKND
ncbi:hypothetical protein CI088_15550 [Enterococcus plantarum]|uniref:Uncharacterized protein n=1 Tax=Enterococcus plantarum TaxID=1077675 RepID=A0A2W3YZB0_9ENTE|nr:hypothetical protein [Enterococcus plantarum]PZL70330.1 hypothetical protein CI088_15550 [Enterococcus plantarum]